MPSIKSRVNGLIINIPADARGVVGRFKTQGGNELIFNQNVATPREQEVSLKVESEAPDNPSKNGHEPEIV